MGSGMEGRKLRRSVTLSDQLSVDESSKLGDLLKLREEEATRPSRREFRVMGPVVVCEKDEASAADGGDDNGGRTLLDIILQENEVNGAVEDGNSSSSDAWKTLRDHFRLHSDDASSLCHLLSISSTEPVASSHHSIPIAVSSSELAEPEPTDVVAAAATSEATTSPEARTASEGGNAGINARGDSNCNPIGATESLASSAAPGEEEGVEEPARVSLMALLEQTDHQWGGSGREELSPVAEDEEEAGSGRGAMSYMCCVCMVRHKGAAFIPCGHTFCRICSRELSFGRGSCPLCNRLILEILDIF